MEGKSRFFVVLAICVLMLCVMPVWADVHYVDSARPNDSGDGLSWENAEKTVQAAIYASVSGDEIWVKAGTYTGCITMKSGIGLYGGFDGAETEKSERDWQTNVTTLHGDGTGSVILSPISATSTIVDGFTITGGTGTWIYNSYRGGGIYVWGGMTIKNNIITDNELDHVTNTLSLGGGICAGGDCTITGNQITNNIGDGDLTTYGGGLWVGGCVTVEHNLISGNSAVGTGGLHIDGGNHSPTGSIKYNTIINNSGRGLVVSQVTGGTVANNLIAGNTATFNGSGIECASPVDVINNTVVYNSTTSACGGIIVNKVNAHLANNIVAFNDGYEIYKTQTGSDTPILSCNCVYDTSGSLYYDFSSDEYADDISSNPLFVDAANGDFHLQSTSPCIDAGYDSVVDTSWLDMDGMLRQIDHVPGGSIVDIGADEYPDTTAPSTPVVTDDGAYTTSNGELHFTWTAATDAESDIARYWYAIGTSSDGSDTSITGGWAEVSSSTLETTATGLTLSTGSTYYISVKAENGQGLIGTAGISNGIACDSGHLVMHVKTASDGGNDNNDGYSWGNSKATIANAIQNTSSDGEIWVKAGTYNEAVTLTSGRKLYGGYSGEGNTRDISTFVTTLDGTGKNNAVVTGAWQATTDTIIDGFTITNGVGCQVAWGPAGGGIYCNGSSLAISNNTITGNTAKLGGGIYSVNCSPVISNNSIINNTTASTGGSGGGVYCYGGSAIISGNTISGNTSSNTGGGVIVASTGSPIITDNTISGNTAVSYGGILSSASNVTISNNVVRSNTAASIGGILCSGGAGSIYNNLIIGNASTNSSGAGIFCQDGAVHDVVNNTIVENTCSTTTGAGVMSYNASPNITNNIVAFNSSGIYKVGSGTATLLKNCVYDNSGGNYYPTDLSHSTDISANPNFVDSTNNNFNLQTSSPCIDAGDDEATGVPNKDIDGITRPIDGNGDSIANIDMGAYEYHRDVAVFESGGTANRRVIGFVNYPVGEEFWNSSTGALNTNYEELLDKWNLGAIRTGTFDRIAWDAQKMPTYKYWNDAIENDGWDAWAFITSNGHILGFDGYFDIISKSNAAWCQMVNMSGILDSYGAAVQDTDGLMTQGAFAPNDPNRDTDLEPSAEERAHWCDDITDQNYGQYTIYKRAQEMAAHLRNNYTSGPRYYELGNETYYHLPIPAAYWKQGENISRVTWGGLDTNSEKLASSWYDPNNPNDFTLDMSFDWTSGHTINDEDPNVLYIGFPYKPWSLRFEMRSAGVGGNLVWQHQKSDGTWDTITPTGAVINDCTWANRAEQIDPNGILEDVENLRISNQYVVANGSVAVTSNSCDLFFLPMPAIWNSSAQEWVGYSAENWDTNGEHHNDWERTQPSEIGGSDVRKLYWLRVYADTAFETAPREWLIKRYYPDPKSWLDSCNKMYDAIKDQVNGDPDGVVLNSGLGLGYMDGEYFEGTKVYKYRNRQYWYYLTNNTYRDKWDGVVIHPYVRTYSKADVPGMVDNLSLGLMKQINDMQDLLDDEELGTRKIACTEWGSNPDVTTSELKACALADGLFCLDGVLAMMRSNADLATWHCIVPNKLNLSSPFYTDESRSYLSSYPTANTHYVVRPVGLAMQMAANHFRTTEHTVTRCLGGASCKAYAFSESGKTSTMVLINPTGEEKTLSLSWPDVAGKSIFVSYLRTKSGFAPSLYNDNEDATNYPNNLEVELTDHTDSGMDVPSDGTFTCDVPAYSAVGIEFRD